jgi:hypothetical protein
LRKDAIGLVKREKHANRETDSGAQERA